jgi:hypothetical protein
MLATTDRATALQLLGVEHNAIRELIDALTDEEKTRPDTIRYGLYSDQRLSFKYLLAHLVTYEVYTLETIDEWKQRRKHPILDLLATYEGGVRVHFGGIAERRDIPLSGVVGEWEQTQANLMQTLGNLSDDEWRSPAPFETAEPTDLGGVVEFILVQPPRPLYRHLPVHIPDSQAYIRSLRRG